MAEFIQETLGGGYPGNSGLAPGRRGKPMPGISQGPGGLENLFASLRNKQGRGPEMLRALLMKKFGQGGVPGDLEQIRQRLGGLAQRRPIFPQQWNGQMPGVFPPPQGGGSSIPQFQDFQSAVPGHQPGIVANAAGILNNQHLTNAMSAEERLKLLSMVAQQQRGGY